MAKKASSDGFSVVSKGDEEDGKKAAGTIEPGDKDHEGDWTEVVDAFPAPPATIPSPTLLIATRTSSGLDEEPNSLSFNDAEELTSAEEELKKATEKMKALEGELAEHEVEKGRMGESMRDARIEKERLEDMMRGVEHRLKEVQDRCSGEQKEKERLGRELLRVREENDRLSKSLQAQADALKAFEDRQAQLEVEKGNLEARFRELGEEKEKLTAKARADAEALKETKARYARQELEKGGLKAELQSISREKEAASLKLFSVTQQLDDMRRDWEAECAKARHLEDETNRLDGEAQRLKEELLERTSEKEQFAVEAKETQEELDHLYQRYAEQDDELNRLKDELHKTTSRSAEVAQAAREAKREGEALKERLVMMEKKWEEERRRLVEEYTAEKDRAREDVQKATEIAQQLVQTVRETNRHSNALKEKMADMELERGEERKRLFEQHANEMRKLEEQEREKATEERLRLLKDHEAEVERLKEGKEQATSNHGKEMVAVRTLLAEERDRQVAQLKEELKEAQWEWDIQRATVTEDHALEKRKWEEEKKGLTTEWHNERSAWAKEREGIISAYNEMVLALKHERERRKEAKANVTKVEEKLARTDSELAKSNEVLKAKEARILELQSGLTSALRTGADARNWEAKAQDAMEESTRLRSVIESMSGKIETARHDLVLEDQAKRQSSEIHFSRPSTSRRGSVETIEPLDAAVSVLYALNSEIFQAAASLADTVEVETRFEGVELVDFRSLMEKIAPFLSEELVISLRSAYNESSDGPNPLLLQVAFQACLAYGCNRFIKSWYPLHWDYGKFLEVLHGRLVDAGNALRIHSHRDDS